MSTQRNLHKTWWRDSGLQGSDLSTIITLRSLLSPPWLLWCFQVPHSAQINFLIYLYTSRTYFSDTELIIPAYTYNSHDRILVAYNIKSPPTSSLIISADDCLSQGAINGRQMADTVGIEHFRQLHPAITSWQSEGRLPGCGQISNFQNCYFVFHIIQKIFISLSSLLHCLTKQKF